MREATENVTPTPGDRVRHRHTGHLGTINRTDTDAFDGAPIWVLSYDADPDQPWSEQPENLELLTIDTVTTRLRELGVDVHTYRHPDTHRYDTCDWGDHDPCPPATVGIYADHGCDEVCIACVVSAAASFAEDSGTAEDVTVEIAELVPASQVGGI